MRGQGDGLELGKQNAIWSKTFLSVIESYIVMDRIHNNELVIKD